MFTCLKNVCHRFYSIERSFGPILWYGGRWSQSDAEHQRQRDRALRLALGAQRWRIVFMVAINAARLALVGTVTGTLLTFAFLRLLIADITVASPPFQVWLIAPLLSAAVVTLASLYPARRASAISPLEIMRDL